MYLKDWAFWLSIPKTNVLKEHKGNSYQHTASKFPETQSQVQTGGCEVTVTLEHPPRFSFLLVPHHLI